MMIIHISFAKIYKYKGWKFDYDRAKPYGPEPLKKDGTPRKRTGRVFYKVFDEFYSLPIEEQEKYREV